jgi:hypothetical protein
VFNIDERIRGLPAKREQVVALFQSINAPHVVVPGKKAGPAQAFIVSIRGATGFGVFIYLYLTEDSDCAVYATDKRTLSLEEYPRAEQGAMAFVESMGFMMDNLNYRGIPPERQEELIRTLPVFQKDPRPQAAPAPAAAAPETPQASTPVLIGKLFTSF